MFETVKIIGKRLGRNMVAFVHDEGPDFDELRTVYRNFKANNPKSAKLMGGFEPLDDKLHPPLQAADMIANNTLEISMDWVKERRSALRKQEMKESMELLGIWEKHYILSILKSELGRRGRPIPIDIQADEYG